MKNPWMKFYPTDWQSDDALQLCSLAARGLWVECLCIMHKSDGFLTVNDRPLTDSQIAIKVGASTEQVKDLLLELESAGVFSRNRDGVIYSRRMLKDAKKSKIAQKNGKTGGNPTLCNIREIKPWDNPQLNQQHKGGDNTQKLESRIKEKINKKEKSAQGDLIIEPEKQKSYKFNGKVIRLSKEDFEYFFDKYHESGGNEDQFWAWLDQRDEWLAKQPPERKKSWFLSTKKAVEALIGE